jgi:hydroxymethylpyrimidine pyrophosphatase-like HAD family hydrolase
MKWRALATDYDGTIATDGFLEEPTANALKRLRESNVPVLLVTGRELSDLLQLPLDLLLFDLIVAENGGVIYTPSDGATRLLAAGPTKDFVDELHRRGVGPISVGTCIVATWQPHDVVVMETIRDMGLEMSVIFNKGAVMILPTGVNKASGLAAALEMLNLSAADVVAVGDAENDHAFLKACGLGVAVANALPALKERADHVTQGDHGAGVVELIDDLLSGAFDSFSRMHPVR